MCSAVIMRALDVGQSHWSASDLDPAKCPRWSFTPVWRRPVTSAVPLITDLRRKDRPILMRPRQATPAWLFMKLPEGPRMADNGFNNRFTRAPKKPRAVELLRGVLRLASKSSISHVQYQRPRPYQPPPPSSTMRTTMMRSVVISICVFLQMLHIAQPGIL